MFLYLGRSSRKASRNMTAVMAVGIRAAPRAAKDVEPEPRCPPVPGV